ncbi:uncharacterized protein METZ01_LOCUS441282, partial [marine metagenome]
NESSTITSLAVGHTTPVSIATGKTLSGAVTVTAGSIKLGETGTLASTVTMSGGTLDADETMTVSGALTQSGDIEIAVKAGKTLTYTGAAISLGANQLLLTGGAASWSTFSNTNALLLDNADSILRLNNHVTVGPVSVNVASNENMGLKVLNSSAISSLTVAADTYLKIKDGKTFSGATEIAEDTTLILRDTGTFGSTLNLKGTLQAIANLEVSGLISVGGDSAISIPSADTTLTYSGAAVNLGANTLTMSGGGTLSNTNA